MGRLDLRGAGAPMAPTPLSVCPHCWGVNQFAGRLCARCGADMQLVLQESGGLRRTAPVQSPVPVPGGARLSPIQRILLLCFLALLIVGQVVGVLYSNGVPGVPAQSATTGTPAPAAVD